MNPIYINYEVHELKRITLKYELHELKRITRFYNSVLLCFNSCH